MAKLAGQIIYGSDFGLHHLKKSEIKRTEEITLYCTMFQKVNLAVMKQSLNMIVITS